MMKRIKIFVVLLHLTLIFAENDENDDIPRKDFEFGPTYDISQHGQVQRSEPESNGQSDMVHPFQRHILDNNHPVKVNQESSIHSSLVDPNMFEDPDSYKIHKDKDARKIEQVEDISIEHQSMTVQPTEVPEKVYLVTPDQKPYNYPQNIIYENVPFPIQVDVLNNIPPNSDHRPYLVNSPKIPSAPGTILQPMALKRSAEFIAKIFPNFHISHERIEPISKLPYIFNEQQNLSRYILNTEDRVYSDESK